MFKLLSGLGVRMVIDAMAVGVGLAFLEVNIGAIALAIGATTFAMVTCGIMVGRWLGNVAGKRAEMVGGLLLIGIGTSILLEHLNAA